MRKLAAMFILIGLTGISATGSAGAAQCGSHRSYEKKAEAISENFEKKIEKLREEAKGLTGEARAEAEAKIDRAQEEWDAVRRDLGRMKPGDDDADEMMEDKPGMMKDQEPGMAEKSWDKMKSMTRSGYRSAEEAYNEAAVYLGLKASQTDPEGKAELEKRIENYMDSLKNRLQAAREAAKELPEESRAEAEKLVRTVREKWDGAEKELARMRKAGASAGQEAWNEIKEEMNTALEELNQAYQSVSDYLSGESS